jgi:uncharacterized protein (UPF0276 family)
MRINDLSFQDLKRLRAVVKKIHFKFYPKHLITNHEADKLIDSWLPTTAEKWLKKVIDAKIDI